jgi:hypothetical protein
VYGEYDIGDILDKEARGRGLVSERTLQEGKAVREVDESQAARIYGGGNKK